MHMGTATPAAAVGAQSWPACARTPSRLRWPLAGVYLCALAVRLTKALYIVRGCTAMLGRHAWAGGSRSKEGGATERGHKVSVRVGAAPARCTKWATVWVLPYAARTRAGYSKGRAARSGRAAVCESLHTHGAQRARRARPFRAALPRGARHTRHWRRAQDFVKVKRRKMLQGPSAPVQVACRARRVCKCSSPRVLSGRRPCNADKASAATPQRAQNRGSGHFWCSAAGPAVAAALRVAGAGWRWLALAGVACRAAGTAQRLCPPGATCSRHQPPVPQVCCTIASRRLWLARRGPPQPIRLVPTALGGQARGD